MTIVLLVEGDTERAFKQHLKTFLDNKAIEAGRPRIQLETRKGISVSPHKLKHRVELELQRKDVTAVVGLIDVYPNFESATDAKAALTRAAGNNPQFYSHVAQYDVEAWLLPYWSDICRRLGVQQKPPGKNPETINGVKPPSYRLNELYRLAKPSRKYVKTEEMYAILTGKDLTVAANQCPEFKAFLNRLLTLSNLTPLP